MTYVSGLFCYAMAVSQRNPIRRLSKGSVPMKQRVILWTGGHPENVRGCERLVQALPELPAPAPLRRAARIVYFWGASRFEIVATACSVRSISWGAESMTWLHCKAMPTAEVKPEETTGMMNVLIPAHYVTAIGAGPTFHISRIRASDDLGVFPPNQQPPTDAVPLEVIERVLAELLTPERN
jgi:hypothetical protein